MRPNYVFETSWEVCNKVGGIYTVVKSKAALMVEAYKDHYFMVGPYFASKCQGEFLEDLAPEPFKAVFDQCAKQGINCHYGKWLTAGEPRVILVDYSGFEPNNNSIKGKLWENYRIDSLSTEFHDYDEPIVWSTAVGKIIEALSKVLQGPIVAHFHEWLAAGGLLYLKDCKGVSTVFTTHATILGRTLASANIDIYGDIRSLDPEKEAHKAGIQAKYQTEKFAAINADVFTTVSEITAIEAERLLGVKPHMILPNGLDMSKFPTFEDLSIKHKLYKSRIMDFIIYHFFPYYHFDLDNTRIFFLCGRYEYHDKGIDVFIDALGKLNERLKAEKSNITVVSFIWVPGNIRGIKQELLENRIRYQDILDSFNDNLGDIKNKLVFLKLAGQPVTDSAILDAETQQELKQKLLRFHKSSGTPPLCTHNLYDEEHDDILSAFKRNNLLNRAEDRVKAVFYAIYLTGADGLLDTSYYESMNGTQLGVFPSYYEPWGYTPLEAGALGVASVTTDLAGFGRYVDSLRSQEEARRHEGIFVLKRFRRSYQEIVADLTEFLYRFSNLSKEERIKNKLEARRIAGMADWKQLVKNYFQAHELAVKNGAS